jgi:DNA-binding transcriptional LysR family regulator
MDLRTLRAFVEVVRQGGFSQAARTVFATQSTVSKAVKSLEHELGTPLLERSGRRNLLTAAGEIAFGRAQRILAERDALVAELGELQGLRRGVLKLGLLPLSGGAALGPMFARYRFRYPDVEIHLVEYGGKRLQELLRAGEIDLAGSLLPAPAEFESLELQREPLVVLLPEGHRLAQRPFVDVASLRSDAFILFPTTSALNQLILEACRRHGFEPVVAARSSQMDFILELVASGLGIAIMPRAPFHLRPPSVVRQVPLKEPGLEWRLAMIWRRGAVISPPAAAWLALLREPGAGP